MNAERLAVLRRAMAENELQAVLITSRQHVFYFSGFDGDDGDLLITLDAAYILCDFRFLQQAHEQSPLFKVKDIKPGIYKVVNEIIAGHGVSKIGLEERALSFAAYSGMKKFISAQVMPLKGLLSDMRKIKSFDEIEDIKKAAEIADKAFAATLKNIKAGISEIEVAAELEYNMRKLGARKTSFDTIIASGANSAKPHGTASEKILENGDMVVMDFGCVYGGYSSDMTRTIAIGGVTKEQKKVYDSVLFTQLKVLSRIKKGEKCNDIDKYSRDLLDMLGYAQYFGHSLGHSVGLDIHEKPSLSPKCDEILKPGMVVTVEPGVYLDDDFGVRIEDLVVICENGTEILTNSPKDLVII